MAKFDPKTWRRFFRLAYPFFVSDVRYLAWGLLTLLIALSLGINYVNVQISFLTRDFMNALNLKEPEEFFRMLLWLLGAFAIAAPLTVFKSYTEERFGLMWRRWLNHLVLDKYFEKRAYYNVNFAEGIDNPDQRLSEDVRTFTAMSLSFSLILFNSVVQLVSFVSILYRITPNLVYGVIGYAFFGSVVTYLLGRPLITLNFRQLQKEADYRYKLINVRENAESIAFLGGERSERTRVRQRLKEALRNFRQIIRWNRNLGFFTSGYNMLTPIIPTVIVAPLYLDGRIKDFGVVAQAGIAFGFVLGSLSILVAHFSNLSNFAAVISRLGTLWETLENPAIDSSGERIIISDGKEIAFREVTLYTPKRDRKLVEKLSFELDGKNLLITGPSGCGKSSLFRAAAGLWHAGSGTIVRPPNSEVMFVPQRAYMVLGTFRSQLLYGTGRQAVTDEELQSVLDKVGLLPTFERVGSMSIILPWPNFLSAGEQQMIQFARFALRSPRYAFLDEATTALDGEIEKQLYALVRSTTTSFVSIGYRRTLANFHDWVLELRSNGTWRLDTKD